MGEVENHRDQTVSVRPKRLTRQGRGGASLQSNLAGHRIVSLFSISAK